MRTFTNTLGLLLLAWALVACSFTDDMGFHDEYEEPPIDIYGGETSLEERIINSSVVVRAVLDSVTSEVVAVPRFDEYAVAIKLHLTVREYLNGSGADNIIALWPSADHYGTRVEAEAARLPLVAQRSTPYDDREAIFFLTDDFWVYGAAKADDTYYLDNSRGFSGDKWSASVDVRDMWNKVWLPLASDGRDYLLVLPGSNMAGSSQHIESSTSTISLNALKARIAAVNFNLNIGRGTAAERRECWWHKYKNERYEDYYRARYGGEPTFKGRNTEHDVASAAPAGTIFFSDIMWKERPATTTASTTWLEGEDSALFEVVDDITSLAEGISNSFPDYVAYNQWFKTLRPLPPGTYDITVKEQAKSPMMQLCFEVVSYDWTVTASDASGATHELFFDPVTVGSAVAADASNGVLKPTSFTNRNGASSTVESISYESGKVRVKVVPWEALLGQVLDVIELDGTVSLSLNLSNSAVDVARHTLTWSVASQPWEDGDMLMVRIRRTAPFAPAPHGLTSTSVGRGSISLSWDSVSGVTGYVVERRVSGDPGWETLDAKVTEKSYTVPDLSCGTSYEFRVGAYGDGTRYETVTGPGTSHYATVSGTTDECSAQGSPAFASAAYSFSVIEDAPVGSTVGAVSATDPEGDTVTYSIASGNEAGRFAIDGSSGRITLAGTLDHDTASSHTLTAQADDGNGGRGTATVSVTVEQASCSNGTAVPNPSANTGLVSDCLTLLSARDALEGTVILNWSDDLAIDSWQGVSIAGTPGRVQSLALSGLELDGAVPSALGELAELRTLELSGNDLTGAVPSSLGKLSRLTRLHLHGNDLSGMIPSELGGLSGLDELRMSENRLTGSIPTELGGLGRLNRLSLDENRLTGSIPASLSRLSDLHTLALADNGLSGTIPVGLGGLAQLRYLSLGGNDLTGSVPSQLGSLSNLRYLYLDQNDLTGAIPTQLGGLSKLEILHLYGNGLTGGIPSTLGGLSKLEELALRGNALTGSIPSELESLSKLVYLTLSGNKLTGCIPSGLRSVTDNDLDRLGLAYCTSSSP